MVAETWSAVDDEFYALGAWVSFDTIRDGFTETIEECDRLRVVLGDTYQMIRDVRDYPDADDAKNLTTILGEIDAALAEPEEKSGD